MLEAETLTAEAFAPFGDVLEANGAPSRLINDGACGRWHDLAAMEFSDGQAGISLFRAQIRSLPYLFDLVERHPEGSQAFIPMEHVPFLVIVGPDKNGRPDTPRAFVTRPGQAINLHRGTWHGVLTPIAGSGLFAVIDRIGPGANLEEYRYDSPFTVTLADGRADGR
ncbi:ureidoglycolate lyase [Notoacmeibacter sp. MSK16QG-6]|uniref:ureidoglycolate lyase n=1 Tax=Notoacmeibacter sp. MSK16QG-6 TaxID=2957982 RepID=UPI00209C89C2|nr:ureidoglycolate lyase [Notoacmeibacter sp. MSK16QG-6]MCP1199766.1 ureidoglycolate lyase [Notoacmeibacter sp. MSK16QG-6]